jgi:hypothetical protein
MADFSLADIKAHLAQHGASVAPDATVFTYQRPAPSVAGEPKVGLLAVERVSEYDEGSTPEYRVHGFCTCIFCEEYCYLGDQTLAAVLDQDNNTYPACIPCMRKRYGDMGLEPDERLEDEPEPRRGHE